MARAAASIPHQRRIGEVAASGLVFQTNKRVPSFSSIFTGCSSDDDILPCTHVQLLIVLKRFKGGKNPTTLLSPQLFRMWVLYLHKKKKGTTFWFLKERSTMI
jgi:hypothetical protein